MPLYVVDGATTTHGGTVHPVHPVPYTLDGKTIFRTGDGFFCPKCKVWSTIIDGDNGMVVFDKPAALEGSTFTCGARLLLNQTRSMRVYGGGATESRMAGSNTASDMAFLASLLPITTYKRK